MNVRLRKNRLIPRQISDAGAFIFVTVMIPLTYIYEVQVRQTGVRTIDIESPKMDCLSFVYVPATSAAHNRLLFWVFFAAAIYSTNEENTRH